MAGALVDADRSLVRCYLPAAARWQTIRGLAAGLQPVFRFRHRFQSVGILVCRFLIGV